MKITLKRGHHESLRRAGCPLLLQAAFCVAFLAAQLGIAQELVFEPIDEPQQEEELETDRDAFTPAMTTVGYRNPVVKSAYSFIEGGIEGDTHSFPEMLTRYGMSDWIELRVGWNYEIGGESSVSSSGTGSSSDVAESGDESRIFYGMKAQVSEPQDRLPRSILIAQAFTPTSGEETTTHLVGTYGFGWELFHRIRWDSSIRYATAGENDDRFNEWAPSTVLRLPIGERWNTHIEYFAVATEGRENELTQAFVSPRCSLPSHR